MKLFSDLIAFAATTWNQEPYNNSFTPLLRAIQAFQDNKTQYKQKRNLLAYNLYLSLPPKVRDEQFLSESSIPFFTLSKLSKTETYPPPNHWIYESQEIRALWEQHLLYGKQADSRLKRNPLLALEKGRLKLDIGGSQSAIIHDEATGEIVGMVYRNFMPGQYYSILEWINRTILTSIGRKKSARVSLCPTILMSNFNRSN